MCPATSSQPNLNHTELNESDGDEASVARILDRPSPGIQDGHAFFPLPLLVSDSHACAERPPYCRVWLFSNRTLSVVVAFPMRTPEMCFPTKSFPL